MIIQSIAGDQTLTLQKKYKVSFTTGGLFYHEAIKAAELYSQERDWEKVRVKILNQNLLKTRTESSRIRTTRELLQRLKTLTMEQLSLLIVGTRQEQNQILWLGVCKQYPFVYDFTLEVLCEKFLRLDFKLTYADFDQFYNQKAEWDEGLDRLTISTRKKLRQVLFRILQDAEIITPAHEIRSAILSPEIVNVIRTDNSAFLHIFPGHGADLGNGKTG